MGGGGAPREGHKACRSSRARGAEPDRRAMSITLDLPRELETELSAEAARLGLSLSEYVVRVLAAGRPPGPRPKDGAQLVNYWKHEGLVGSRSEIPDGQKHASELRRRAERRAWR